MINPVAATTVKKKHLTFLDRIGMSNDRDYFIENLSMLASSGMNILSALDAIREEVR